MYLLSECTSCPSVPPLVNIHILPLLEDDRSVPLLTYVCRVPVAWEVGVPVAWEVGVPVAWEVGVPVAWEVGVPVAWEVGCL